MYFQLFICALWMFLSYFVVVNAVKLEFNVENDVAISAISMGKTALKINENFFGNVVEAISLSDGSSVTTRTAKSMISDTSSNFPKEKLLDDLNELEIMIKSADQKVQQIYTSYVDSIETALRWSEDNKDEIRQYIIMVKQLINEVNKNNSDDFGEVINAARKLKQLITSLDYAWEKAKDQTKKQITTNENAEEALYKVKNKLDEIIEFVKKYKSEIGVDKLISHLEYSIQHLSKTVLNNVRITYTNSQNVDNFVSKAIEKYEQIKTSIDKLENDINKYKEEKNPKAGTQQKDTELQTTGQQQWKEDAPRESTGENKLEDAQQSTINEELKTTTLVSENQEHVNEQTSELTLKKKEGKETLQSKTGKEQENLTPQQTSGQQQNNEVLRQVTQNTSNTQQLKQKLQNLLGFYDGTSVTLSFATVIYVSCFAPVCMFFATLVA